MTFSLAALLRVRGTQERVAAEQLSQAAADRRRVEGARERAAASLAELEDVIHDRQRFIALAAARAAGFSALNELHMLAELRRKDEERAKAAHVEARRSLRGLERLESTYRAESVRARLAAEQVALDEIAVARAARRAGSAA
ncbi:hypothetical protein GCM10009775_06950 [Microbacterium aoyamense]|uniref:Flagellar FliJ protein n=1 Tax=Microbacterium aoyamense TaxID=344166 RepID=A0ABN2PET1_9MICO|nr:hypothetical protein [Microbacterium aoyamense]